MAARRGPLKYELLLLLMAIIWGSAFVAQEIGMMKGLGPMTFNGMRFALGSLTLLPVIIWRRCNRPPGVKSEKLPVAGSLFAGLFLFAAASFQQIGLKDTTSANAGFITGFYILFVPLLGLLFGHKARLSLWVGILVSLMGLYLLSVGDGLEISKGDPLILICAAFWACQILVIDHVASRGDPIQIALIQFVVCAVLSSLSAVIFETCTMEAAIAGSGAVAYAGIMSVGVAFTLQVVCQKRCPPAPAAVIMSLEAVFAAISGYLILNQLISTKGMIGCVLILCGILIVQLVPILESRTNHHG